MWKSTISEVGGGTGNVTATFTDELKGESFSYSSIIKVGEASAFVTKAKAGLVAYRSRKATIDSLQAQLETALNS